MSNGQEFGPLGSQSLTTSGPAQAADMDPRLARTHYFDGRLLTAEDLNRDQLYLDQRLREVGQALGTGVLRGLEVALDGATGRITVQPGIGIANAGRVLHLKQVLNVDLGDRGLIASLNGGLMHFNQGLYALALRYAETGRDMAEVFPTDLAAERRFQHNYVAEGVELTLVPLPRPLTQADPLSVRADLIVDFLGGGVQSGVIPEDAVALGVLAIAEDRPQWLDSTLLRQPLRRELLPGDLQADISRHYEALLRDVLIYRQTTSLRADFAASEYIRLLPPAGSLPKDSVDPLIARHGFFPEQFNVWIAPIRLSDLELVRNESMKLPAIDLSNSEPVNIVVLAGLANQDFGHYAEQLMVPYEDKLPRLPSLDLLRLRLYRSRPLNELDPTQTMWEALWPHVLPENLLYVRRPTRAAETGISGIVLAQGTSLPPPPESAEPPTATPTSLQPTTTTTDVAAPAPAATVETRSVLVDEDKVFLERVSFQSLGKWRPPQGTEGEKALAVLQADMGSHVPTVLGCLAVLLRLERQYDSVVWQTLRQLSVAETLRVFLKALVEGQAREADTALVVLKIGPSHKLDEPLLEQWKALVQGPG